jgi:hypothetical protein
LIIGTEKIAGAGQAVEAASWRECGFDNNPHVKGALNQVCVFTNQPISESEIVSKALDLISNLCNNNND